MAEFKQLQNRIIRSICGNENHAFDVFKISGNYTLACKQKEFKVHEILKTHWAKEIREYLTKNRQEQIWARKF